VYEGGKTFLKIGRITLDVQSRYLGSVLKEQRKMKRKMKTRRFRYGAHA